MFRHLRIRLARERNAAHNYIVDYSPPSATYIIVCLLVSLSSRYGDESVAESKCHYFLASDSSAALCSVLRSVVYPHAAMSMRRNFLFFTSSPRG